jgi:hypothetical protein
MVKGEVHMVFFDTSVRYFNVTGKTLEEITNITRGITEGGMTSVGCGLDYAISNKLDFDGIAVVSDGLENANPPFCTVYERYIKLTDRVVPVYYYHVDTQSGLYRDTFMETMAMKGFSLETFDLGSKPDYYSLPNLVKTMRVNKYSLVDEVFATKLLTLKEVFDA